MKYNLKDDIWILGLLVLVFSLLELLNYSRIFSPNRYNRQSYPSDSRNFRIIMSPDNVASD